MRTATKLLFILILVSGNVAAAGTEGLFLPPRETIGRINPGGTTLAIVVNDDGYQKLETIVVDGAERSTHFSTELLNSEKTAITALEWVDDDTLIIAAVELTEGVAKLSDTRNRTRLLVIETGGTRPLIRVIESDGMLVDALPQEEGAILFARSGSTSIVYRIDTTRLHEWRKPMSKTARVDGGQFSRSNRVAEVDGTVARWLTSASGTVRAALRWNEEDGLALLIRDDEHSDWKVEHAWPQDKKKKNRKRSKRHAEAKDDEVYLPISLIENTDDFIVRATDEAGRTSIYRYNYSTQKKAIIYQRPAAEIVSVGLDYRNAVVLYVSYFENGVVRYHYVDDAYRDVADYLRQVYPAYSASIVATDKAENRFYVYMTSETQPGKAYIFEKDSERLMELYAVMPWIDESTMARSIAGTVDSHGLEIEYFLTVPESVDRVPLLVYPHGGPWGVSDNRHFNPAVQYLASRGMAVLQVNYRGSGGYGEEFARQGQGEFGKRMLDDIEVAMNAVLQNPSIDSSRVCAIGESYGGYAALMLAIRSPERFACVASYAGVTDLGLLLGSYAGNAADSLLSMLTTEELTADVQYELLRDMSPVYNAERLRAPVFLAHGTDDVRVDIEHSYRMLARLEQLRKSVTFKELPDQGHSFVDPESTADYYEMLADFAEEQLR